MRAFGQNTVIAGTGLIGAVVLLWPSLGPVILPVNVGVMLLVLAVFRLTAEDTPGIRRWLMGWTLGALAAHLVVGLMIYATAGLGRDDALWYHTSAKAILNHWEFGSPLPVLLPGKATFFYAIAALYRVVGPHPAALIAVNAVLGAALVPVMTDTTRRLFDLNAARPVPALVTFLPSILLWASQPLREALVLLLVALAINAGVRLSSGPSLLPAVTLVASVGALMTLRLQVAVTVALGIVLAMMLSRRPQAAGTAIFLSAAFAGSALLFQTVGMPGTETLGHLNLRDINTSRIANSRVSTSGFSGDEDAATPGKASIHTLTNLPESFAGPFPWHLRTVRHLAVLPDCIPWWLLLPMLWAGLRAGFCFAGTDTLFLALPALLTQLLLSLGIGDYGTLFRERPQVAVILLPLIALGLSRWRRTPAPVPQFSVT